MDADRFDALAKMAATSTSRRQVVKTGVKLAYAAPLVAATFPLAASAAESCGCPTGSVAIPDWVVAKLRQYGLNSIANAVSGQCIGCKIGAITPPSSDLQWTNACKSIGRAIASVCPGAGNKIVLKAPTCNHVSM